MRIAVLSPNYGFLTGGRSMHRWAEEFINNHADCVVNYEQAKTYDGDAIVCFNGRPDLPNNIPPKEFKGIKAVHLMDHVFRAEESRIKMLANGITHVLTYNKHDEHDEFFKFAYPEWVGKVIPVPFGYNDKRFSALNPFNKRKNKVVALGSVNPVSDPLCLHDIQKFAQFFKGEEFTHKWRRTLCVSKNLLTDQMDSLLPTHPKTKDFDYDIVAKYNEYKMFTSCESIMHYPSVKTFEGMACGSALVCSDHPCYDDIGLVDGVNCIKHKQHDLKDFQNKVAYYQAHQDELERIAICGKEYVESTFTPKIIALKLYNNLTNLIC